MDPGNRPVRGSVRGKDWQSHLRDPERNGHFCRTHTTITTPAKIAGPSPFQGFQAPPAFTLSGLQHSFGVMLGYYMHSNESEGSADLGRGGDPLR